ncbi:hypothetical protein KIN20_033468 [Parelaphostrongylus tenuis]|uniref:Uncharacterized protein n=1 Tax=Parelaphostrongylus tenuis TaxID=148309 RepID=A0AAD5R827_PARTN|nr:hypothetical protein KIN20_033468 [Parelaphostrongylus tenuis]
MNFSAANELTSPSTSPSGETAVSYIEDIVLEVLKKSPERSVEEQAKHAAIVKAYEELITEQEILDLSSQLRVEGNGNNERARTAMERLRQIVPEVQLTMPGNAPTEDFNEILMYGRSLDVYISPEVIKEYLQDIRQSMLQRLALQSVAKSTDRISSNETKDYPSYHARFTESWIFFYLDSERAGSVLIESLIDTGLMDRLFERRDDEIRGYEQRQEISLGTWTHSQMVTRASSGRLLHEELIELSVFSNPFHLDVTTVAKPLVQIPDTNIQLHFQIVEQRVFVEVTNRPE